MKEVYPVIFTKNKKTILIEVPDLGILTQGKNLPDAIAMARDAIGLKGISLEDDHLPIPKPTDIEQIDVTLGTFAKEGVSFVSLVDIDFVIYRKILDEKMVRKNVTLPNWLNARAEEMKINVSGVLQEALMERVGGR